MADSIGFIVQNKKNYVNDGLAVKLYTDVTTEIDITLPNDVTSYAVETGEDITDNVRQQNKIIRITGIVADHPLQRYSGNQIEYGININRRKAFYDYILGLRNNSTEFTLVTDLDSYEGCVVKHIRIPTRPDTAKIFTFEMEVHQIRRVSAGSINVLSPNVSADKKLSAGTTENKGGKDPNNQDSKDYDALKEAAKVFKEYGEQVDPRSNNTGGGG